MMSAQLQLEGEPDAVPRARRLVGTRLAEDELEDLVADAQLVVSELVTNAVLHGKPPITLRVTTGAGWARLEVYDRSPQPPVRPPSITESMTGRGLALVDAVAARWGAEPTDSGKVCWAELAAGNVAVEPMGENADASAILAQWEDLEPDHGEQRYTVTLGDVPTDLLLAAKSHVDNLVREFALAAGGAHSGSTPAIPPHLAHLIDGVTTRFAEARQSIKRQALAAAAAGLERTQLSLTLPLTAADAGKEYLAALDEADSYARAARLLTLETPPQHQAFRRWYVGALVTQLRAIADGKEPPPALSFEQYLLDTLEIVSKAHRLADRSARLQAVTASLAQTTTEEEVAEVVLTEGLASLGASGGSLLVPLDNEHIAVPGAVGYPRELVAKLQAERLDSQLPAAQALRTGAPVWLESRHERDTRYPELVGMEPATIAMCALPLVVRGTVLGALRFSFDRPRLFDDDERQFIVGLAAQAAAALERARLFAVERENRQRMAFLAEATQLLASSLEPAQTLRRLTALLVPTFADWAVVLLRGSNGSVNAVAAAHRDPGLIGTLQQRFEESGFARSDALGIRTVLRDGGTQSEARVAQAVSDRFVDGIADPWVASKLAPRSFLTSGLTLRGSVLGAVVLVRTQPPAYGADVQQIIEDVTARAAVAVANAQQYARERETALTLQQSLLPQQLPRLPGLRLAWRYLPAGAGALVGGDWYDVLPLEEDKVALVIGDVMGRGVHAAAVMGQLRATARAYAAAYMPPSAVLHRLDAAVGRLQEGHITTAAFAILDRAAKRLTVASAGHLPPLLVPARGTPSFMRVEPGPPLGVGVAEYPESSMAFGPGNALLLYTDGLVEGANRPVDVGMERLRRAARGVTDVEVLCDRALAALPHEDITEDDTAILAVGWAD